MGPGSVALPLADVHEPALGQIVGQTHGCKAVGRIAEADLRWTNSEIATIAVGTCLARLKPEAGSRVRESELLHHARRPSSGKVHADLLVLRGNGDEVGARDGARAEGSSRLLVDVAGEEAVFLAHLPVATPGHLRVVEVVADGAGHKREGHVDGRGAVAHGNGLYVS